jgi:hypothetical protein
MAAINDHFVYKVGRPKNLKALIIDNYFGPPIQDESFLGELRLGRSLNPSAMTSPDTSIDLSEERKQLVPSVSPRNHRRELRSNSLNDSFTMEQPIL